MFNPFGWTFSIAERGPDWFKKTKLTEAVQEGELEDVKELIISLDYTSPEKWPNDLGYFLLCDAIKLEYADVAKLLLENGANVTSIQADHPWHRVTPLHYAVEMGMPIEVTKMILDRGVQINATDDAGRPALYDAVTHDRFEHAKLLLEYRADPDVRDNFGSHLLHVAVQNGSLEFVKLLLHYGAYVDSRNQHKGHDCTALHIAVLKGEKNITKFLLREGADVNLRDFFGRTALHMACTQRYTDGEIVIALLDYGSDLNATCANYRTPLNYATAEDVKVEGSSDLSYNKPTLFLTRDITLMKAANLDVSYANLLIFKINENIDTLKKLTYWCEQEVAHMKIYKTIWTTNISYYDILVKDTRILEKLMRNRSLAMLLDEERYKDLFPLYSRMIDSRVAMALDRKDLLERGTKMFPLLNSNLPENCIEEIFSYLSIQDLRVFCHAGWPYSVTEELPTYANSAVPDDDDESSTSSYDIFL